MLYQSRAYIYKQRICTSLTIFFPFRYGKSDGGHKVEKNINLNWVISDDYYIFTVIDIAMIISLICILFQTLVYLWECRCCWPGKYLRFVYVIFFLKTVYAH